MTPLPIVELIRQSQGYFGQPSWVAQGALDGYSGTMEPADALEIVQDWLGTDTTPGDTDSSHTDYVVGGRYRGDWTPDTDYHKNDIVVRPTDQVAVTANVNHTSGSSYTNTNWTAFPGVSGGSGGGLLPDVVIQPGAGIGGAGLTNDHVALQAAVTGLAAGGKILVRKGLYRVDSEVLVAQYSNSNDHLTIEFEDGAILKRTNASARDPIMRVLRSDTVIRRPQFEGSATKGNGTALKFGPEDNDAVSNVPYRVTVYDPIVKKMDTGVETGLDLEPTNPNEGNSCGDCVVFGGFFDGVKVGIRNRGFINRFYSPMMNNVNIGYVGTGERLAQRAHLADATINNWSVAAFHVEGGEGTTISGGWFERPQSTATAPQIGIFGSSTAAGDAQNAQARNTRLLGVTTLECSKSNPETALFTLRNASGLRVDCINIDTNGGPPTYYVQCEATHTGTHNVIEKIELWPGYNSKNQFAADGDPDPGYPTPINNLGTGDIWIYRVPDVKGTPRGRTVIRDLPGQVRIGTAEPVQGALPPGTTYYKAASVPAIITEPVI